MSATWDGMKAGENALIPPDEPENYLVDTEYGDGVIRNSYKDGTSDWHVQDLEHDCVPQDAMEAAYELGFKAGQKSREANPPIDMVSYNKGSIDGFNEGYEYGKKEGHDKGYGKGAVDAAVTLRQGRPHSEGGDDANRDDRATGAAGADNPR